MCSIRVFYRDLLQHKSATNLNTIVLAVVLKDCKPLFGPVEGQTKNGESQIQPMQQNETSLST